MAQPTIQNVLDAINMRHDSTENKIEQALQGMRGDIDDIREATQNNTYKLSELEKNIECLKQDRLKNNIKIAGLPDMKFEPKTLMYSLCNLLDIELLDDEFTAYHTRNGNFVIVQFDSYKKKSLLFKKVIEKRTIMTEELFDGTESNSQIYISDQLTPYFAKIFQLARVAKKDAKIHQVSSRGGKIRVKKTERALYEFIFSEYDLNEIINETTSTNTEIMNTSTLTNNHTETNNNKMNNNKSEATAKNNKKRRVDLNTSGNNNNKKSKIVAVRDNTPRNNKSKITTNK